MKLTARAIRRELAMLIEARQSTCTTDKERNRVVNESRADINRKYGNDWRFKYSDDWHITKCDQPSYNIPSGDEWSDYAITADDL